MTIPLWLLWSVAAALFLTAFFTQSQRRVDGLPIGLDFLGRCWSAAVIAIVVAGVLTFDRYHVTEDELHDAVERAATSIGSTDDPNRVQYAAEDRLGHGLTWESVDGPADEEESEGGRTYYYEFKPSEDSDTVACLEVATYNDASLDPSLSVSTGSCADA